MNRQIWLLTSYLLLATRLAWGADFVSLSEPPFFIDKERGWFWREVEPDTQPKPNKQPEKANPDTEAKHLPPPIPPQNQQTQSVIPEPSPLSAEWFRKNLERYRDKAIDEPSPENVAAYYYLQRVMMDKAQRFTDVARRVVMSDPLLDENQRRPIATFAANEANYQAGIASEQALAAIAKQAGILFFFRSDCRYCHIQAPLLALLEKRFGFKVYAVSLDGRPMPNGLYPDFHVDQGQAHLLGVISTPALFLMRPPDGIVQLAQGAVSLDDLSGRRFDAGGGFQCRWLCVSVGDQRDVFRLRQCHVRPAKEGAATQPDVLQLLPVGPRLGQRRRQCVARQSSQRHEDVHHLVFQGRDRRVRCFDQFQRTGRPGATGEGQRRHRHAKGHPRQPGVAGVEPEQRGRLVQVRRQRVFAGDDERHRLGGRQIARSRTRRQG